MAPPRWSPPPLNLVLFESAELAAPLPRQDRRALHVLDVLRRKVGESFDAGVIDGAQGKATIMSISADVITVAFQPIDRVLPREPITLLVGLPRPQTARDILRDATTLGVEAIHFVVTEKGERSYATSTLWMSGEWRRHVIAGAEQAFVTRLPKVSHGENLATILAKIAPDAARIALDPYEATLPLGDCPLATEQHVVLALGAERGWSANERVLLRQHCFALTHLGARILRTETAAVTALAVVRARLGLL